MFRRLIKEAPSGAAETACRPPVHLAPRHVETVQLGACAPQCRGRGTDGRVWAREQAQSVNGGRRPKILTNAPSLDAVSCPYAACPPAPRPHEARTHHQYTHPHTPTPPHPHGRPLSTRLASELVSRKIKRRNCAYRGSGGAVLPCVKREIDAHSRARWHEGWGAGVFDGRATQRVRQARSQRVVAAPPNPNRQSPCVLRGTPFISCKVDGIWQQSISLPRTAFRACLAIRDVTQEGSQRCLF